ncbi:MAG: aminodeoxychorismate synthase component I [Acidimicrobiia bacterium]
MQIRFDDLRPGRESSLGFIEPVEILRTDSPATVPDLLTAAEQRALAGSWVAGFLAYEAAGGFDAALETHPPRPDLPVAWFAVFKAPVADPPWPPTAPYRLSDWEADADADEYRSALDTIHHHIGAGDTYQVNYTMRMRGRFAGDPVSAYRDLLAAQVGGFGAYLDLGDEQILSASPELFFRWDEDGITTRPMKGTIGRGRWSAEDEEQRIRLAASEKDRAENLMIVDLLRNDLGRIARFGSVEVLDLFAIERFQTVWQMTSTIRAQPREDVGLADVMAGLFPSGSVTGAPKARTMQIIRDLESSPRGIYCGAIGLLAPPGSGEPRAQFNVAIRTLVVDPVVGSAAYGTGGGITWDSRTEDEHNEALLKAAVLTHHRPPFSLLETMRWSPTEGIFRRHGHVGRMQASAAYFGVPFPAAAIKAKLDGVTAETELRVRLLLDADGSVEVEVEPLKSGEGPVRLAVDTHPIEDQNVFHFHKTTNRTVYQEAAGRHPDVDDVVLVNRAGMATETTSANLAVRLGEEWVTPPVGDGCLPGVLRGQLVAEGTLREQSVPAESLGRADELAIVSSLRGWRVARLADGP